MKFLFLALFSATSAQAEIKEFATMSKLAAQLSPRSVVIFDLDNTVIESKTSLGSDQWFSQLVKDNLAAGHTDRDAKNLAVAQWQQVQPLVHVRPVEPITPGLIDKLRRQGHRVIGLTARPDAVRADTFRQLKEAGVDLTTGNKEANLCFTLEVESCFYDGVLFVNNSDKGKALLRLARELDWKLADVVMIDDKLHNVEAVNTALNAWNIANPKAPIHHIELRYSAADARVAAYNHDLATLQLRLISKILSDDTVGELRELLRGKR